MQTHIFMAARGDHFSHHVSYSQIKFSSLYFAHSLRIRDYDDLRRPE
jgi:hypothetical protein